jgi:hypothetical protein
LFAKSTCKKPVPSSSMVPCVDTCSLVNIAWHLSHLGKVSIGIACLWNVNTPVGTKERKENTL